MESPDNFVTPLYGLDGVDRSIPIRENLFKRISERYNGDFYIYQNNVLSDKWCLVKMEYQ